MLKQELSLQISILVSSWLQAVGSDGKNKVTSTGDGENSSAGLLGFLFVIGDGAQQEDRRSSESGFCSSKSRGAG